MTARPFFAGSLSRALALIAAAGLSLMIYPYALGRTMDRMTHTAPPVLLLGVASLLTRRV